MRNNNKMKAVVVGAFLSSVCFVTWADQLDEIRAKGTLVCGVLGAFEPFGFTDVTSRSLVGYDVDICTAIAAKLGVKAEPKAVSIEARIPELQQGRMDVLVAGLGYSPLRAEQVAFSNGYFVSDHKLTVKASGGFSSPKDLSGKRVSFTKGGITESFVRSAVPDAKLTGFEDTPTAFTALIQNKVAAFSVSEVVARRLINKLGRDGAQFKLLEPPVGQESWGVGVKKDEPALLAAVNGVLNTMESSGEAQNIFNKWLGVDTSYHMERSFKIAPIPR